MLRNENIICISSIDWDFIWQGHQEIMSTFARNGNRVLFIENTGVRPPSFRDLPRLKKRIINWFKSIEGFREEMKNLYVYSPIILPFPYSKFVRWINRYMLIRPIRKWMKIMEFYNPIVWTFLPTEIALGIIDNVDAELLIYYCIADFSKLVDSAKKLRRTENELIKKSDLVFVQGKILGEKCKRLNDNVHIFPFGVNIETFENFQSLPDKVPRDIRDIRRPILGYIGGIHKHIDFKLIRFIAETHPEWSIVLIGPVQTNVSEIYNLQNIFLLGKKDFSNLPTYINEFDVAIIPYNKSRYTATVFPTKLNEYHAMGKPVVSTDLPEIINFNVENKNLILVGKTYEEFADCITKAFSGSNESINQRILSARENNWNIRIEKMADLLEKALERKAETPVNWQESLIKFYRQVRKKTLNLAAVFLCIYFLVFYTPLIWFIASPLKISQMPQKADCIVVFAGGVGESGKAGQGYEERVEHAANLYKAGYATNLVFSSGYSYFFNEARVMKALAVSLGIPSDVIILEESAINTLHNVKFTNEILKENNWNSILLVSSPYHMRRVSLVAKNVAHGIKIIYTPIPESRFYKHGIGPKGEIVWKQINLQQIKGLLHEYLGILYYWWKGWI